MGDQETFKAAVWYNGKIVNQDGNNPRYAGGIVKYIDVDPNTTVEAFLATVRGIFGIPEAVPITVKYHIFFSSEISRLLGVGTPYESLKLMLQPGLMLHPFYVEENVVEDGTDTNSKETKCKRSAGNSNAIQSPPTGVEMQANKRSANATVVGDRVGRTSANSSKMQIIIKSLCGLEKRLNVERTETVESVKERIRKTEGTAVKDQRLIYAGKQLEDNRTLADYVKLKVLSKDFCIQSSFYSENRVV